MTSVAVTAGVSVTATREDGDKRSGFLKGEHKVFDELKHEFGELLAEAEEEETSAADRLEADLREIEEIPDYLWDRIRFAIRKHVR